MYASPYYFPERPLDPPEVPTFTGYVTFACVVEEATVEVQARVADDELLWDTVTVWYCGTEVSALLGDKQTEQIQRYFDDHITEITEFDSYD